MTPERWKEMSALYHAAGSRLPHERPAFLAEACRGDEALRREIESLLNEPVSIEGFLDGPSQPLAPEQVPDHSPGGMTGRILGGYHLQALLGAGGMGEVYRARDSNLGRDVAIKILPRLFTSNPDRLARFEREARVLASLNHPNICAIYGFEQADDIRFLILELVDGETLGDTLAQGSGLKVSEALAVARQIADAVDAAHERGVIHRDLKPANIKITAGGVVKVLDFGLAKAAIGDGSGPDFIRSPTRTIGGGTAEGVILGTAAYMSPEQARGRPVDRRADVWAFGAVFFEMLTGRPLFTGETVTDVIAAVVTHEPDWDALPAETPLSVRRLLRRCLEKDPKQRLRDIGDARLELNDESTMRPDGPGAGFRPHDTVAPLPLRGGRVLPWVAAAVCLLTALTLAFVHFREVPLAPARTVRFEVQPPAQATVTSFQVSPDGRYLALVANEIRGTRLWVRPLDSLTGLALPGTDGAEGTPFWSPDGAFIGFFAEGKLKKVSVAGGPPETLCDGAPGLVGTGTWNRDGVIIFGGRVGSPLQRLSEAGGAPLALGETSAPGERYSFPHFLPDGRRFLYTNTGGNSEVTGIYVGSLDGAPPVRVSPDPSPAIYAPPLFPGGTGYLLFRRDDTLMAQAFSLDDLQKDAEMVPVANQVRSMTASQNGVLALQGAIPTIEQLVWVDRTGKQLGQAGPPGLYTNFRLAPKERAIAFDRQELSTRISEIWTLDILRGVPTRLTFDPAVDNVPIWSFDGSHVLFSSARKGGGKFDLYLKAASGAGPEELLIEMGTLTGYATDWSEDGKYILYQKPDAKTARDLWIAPQFGERAPFPYLHGPYNESDAMFSPDGRWIAYVSDESGQNEVYVQAFPRSSEKRPISTGGGSQPNWRADGGELFYLAADRSVMAASVSVGSAPSGPIFEPAVPKPLFRVPGNDARRSYAAAADGQRFLLLTPVGEATPSPLTVVLNWMAALKR